MKKHLSKKLQQYHQRYLYRFSPKEALLRQCPREKNKRLSYYQESLMDFTTPEKVWLEELLQTRWTDLKVNVTSVSEQWAAAAVSGPKSREVIQQCLEDPSLIENDNFANKKERCNF